MKLWVEQSARPFYVAIEHTPADLRAPKTLVVCTEDKIFPMDLQVLCAETWGANQVEVKTGHSPWMNAEARKKIVATIRDHAEKTRA